MKTVLSAALMHSLMQWALNSICRSNWLPSCQNNCDLTPINGNVPTETLILNKFFLAIMDFFDSIKSEVAT